jgi:hypothetical protein
MALFEEFIWPFHAVVSAHIVTGAIGLFAFWVPIFARKGGASHRLWGKVFTLSMLATGGIAIAISSLTLADPVGTHPHLEFEPALIEGIFGWMMLYLAILTINLAWYGWSCIRGRRAHAVNRQPLNLFLQAAVTVSAANCAWHGLLLGQSLMIGISFVGFATAATNLWFIYKPRRGPQDWLKEHLKGLVGAGISVYTAFFAFGAVRLMPELALNPALWAAPLVIGLAIILHHWRRIGRQQQARAGTAHLAS